MNSTGYEHHKIRESLSRPQLLFGAERELVLKVLSILFLCMYMAFQAQLFVVAIIPVILAFIALRWMRMMAKKDPMLSKLYFRSRAYQQYFSPQSTPHGFVDEFRTNSERFWRWTYEMLEMCRVVPFARYFLK